MKRPKRILLVDEHAREICAITAHGTFRPTKWDLLKVVWTCYPMSGMGLTIKDVISLLKRLRAAPWKDSQASALKE